MAKGQFPFPPTTPYLLPLPHAFTKGYNYPSTLIYGLPIGMCCFKLLYLLEFILKGRTMI